MTALVGHTGFVGSNLYEQGAFDAIYNSKNIEQAFKTEPDLLVYAGLRAEKFLANTNPDRDLEQVRIAEENISRIKPKKLVLISTIDVFRTPVRVDEHTAIDTTELQAYGYHRLLLEKWVRERYSDALIIRLPALFGKNLKKNFLYDMMHPVPALLSKSKFSELSRQDPELSADYQLQDNGFYACSRDAATQQRLREKFRALGFSALQFTDSRSVFQFYPLRRLWSDIQTALAAGLTLWHPATEPLSAAEIYDYVTGESFVNELETPPALYDYRTLYAKAFGGASESYIMGKRELLCEIKEFIKG
ncbi:MAG: sugar nucleotide-binding protein [Lachnospiraceae bacterium]|nr:sugar nucleotide-binding protein [Lachnospiraceae bacterium]